MTIGSVLALVASRRVGLRQRMLAQAEIGAVDIGELRYLISAIAKITLLVESSIAAILFAHLATIDDTGVGRAAYSAMFHGVSAFNNAGISLYSDSLTQFVDDPARGVPDHGRVRDRRARLPDPRRVPSAGTAQQVESAHPDHAVRHRVPARRSDRSPCSWSNGRTPPRSGRWASGTSCRPHGSRGDATNRRLQHDRHRRPTRTDPQHHDGADVHRRRPGIDERWHQGHHLRRARLRDVGGGARRQRRQRVQPPATDRVSSARR